MRLPEGYAGNIHHVWYQPPRQAAVDLDKVVRDVSGTGPGLSVDYVRLDFLSMNEPASQQNQPFPLAEDTASSIPASGTPTGQVPDNTESEEGLLSTSEAATLAGVDSRTIRRWHSSGKIRGKLDGHKLLVYEDDIDKLSGTTPGTVDDFSPPDPGQEADMSGAQIVEVDVTPEEQNVEPARPETNPERDRLITIIEGQAHQLKAAGDVIMYLRSQLDEKEDAIKLLTCSKSLNWWQRLSARIAGKTGRASNE